MLANFYIFVFALPFGRVRRRLTELRKQHVDRLSRGRIASFVVSVLVSTSILVVVVGTATHGRYYTPLLLWLALLCLLEITRLLPGVDLDPVLARWRWVGLVQLLFVVLALALPYKYKAYARYRDYHTVADEHEGYVVVSSGNLGFARINSVEKRLPRVYDFDGTRDFEELSSRFASREIESFIFAYGIDAPERALLKRVLPKGLIRKLGISPVSAEDWLERKGFTVTTVPLEGATSRNVFLAKRAAPRDVEDLEPN
jgi:hypothetical protein